jgi:hypothetical protein
MRRHPHARLLVPLALGALLVSCQAGPTDNTHRAALIVVHPDGGTRTACVSFPETEISGYELLNRSGIPLVIDAGNPMGVMVCAIDGEGCAFPAEHCLCECSAPGSCTYWAYFARNPDGSWAYSPNGASARAVSDGDMDAWVWLSGSGPSGPATPPVPDTPYAEICP